jgi:L-lactate dehydrogenase complex protein LldE
MVVDLFIGCYNDTLFPRTGQAVVTLLERLGHVVEFRDRQTCCGQMHSNNGYAVDATSLMRRFVRVFADAATIVTPSASCAALVREWYPRLAEQTGDAALLREVVEIVPRVHELTLFLTDVLGIEDVGARYPHRVVFHPTCHSLRGLGSAPAAMRLLRSVRDIEIVELSDADSCCGFGGTFAIKNRDTSIAMVGDKVRAIVTAQVETCVSADNSCLLHIGGALSRGRTGVQTVHLAEVLAAA